MAEEQGWKRVAYEVRIHEEGPEGGGVRLRAQAFEVEERQVPPHDRRLVELKIAGHYRFVWHPTGAVKPLDEHGEYVLFEPAAGAPGEALVRAELKSVAGDAGLPSSPEFRVRRPGADGGPPARAGSQGPVPVRLTRPQQASTRDLILWIAIRYSTESIQYPNYQRFLDYVLCGEDDAIGPEGERLETDEAGIFSVPSKLRDRYDEVRKLVDAAHPRATMGGRRIPLTGVDAYRALREATDWFLKIYCGVLPPERDFAAVEADLVARVGAGLEGAHGGDAHHLREAWHAYTVRVNGVRTLPYLAIVRDRLAEQALPSRKDLEDALIQCTGLIRAKLAHPCFIEFIWSYWQEEGMLVQTLNAVANRFQNRGPRSGGPDPLANFELTPLRPLDNLLWGYVQDDLGRLSVVRRAHEYEHVYGCRLEGKAVTGLRPVERRTKFLPAFHTFLLRCVQFYKLDDNTTVIADAFPVLNAIKEVHYLLAQGAGNQFGDLPTTARAEMLVQQWLLGRPEMREFLGSRAAVPYPEPWMDRVDAMKALQGWTDTSVVHFNDLATFGEQILLGLRYGGWSTVNDPAAAANFVRFWRPQIQGYVHAYLAVTGVDLGAELTSAQSAAQRGLPPSVHLLRRLQARRAAR